jgi:hypothetical protein
MNITCYTKLERHKSDMYSEMNMSVYVFIWTRLTSLWLPKECHPQAAGLRHLNTYTLIFIVLIL